MPRVKISRTVDLEEIPNEVTKYMNETIVHASVLSESLKSATRKVQNKNISGAIKELQQLRDILYKIDNGIADNSSILQGYYQAINDELAPQQTQEQSAAPPERGPDE
jgi:small-conductance mechanosensitive channel